MRRILVGVASMAGVLLLVAVMLGGLYLRSQRLPVTAGQGDASPSQSATLAGSPTPSDSPSPSPTPIASPVAPSPAPRPSVRPGAPSPMGPTCPPEVITGLVAKPAPASVVLTWTVTGGCGDETGWIQGSFAGTMYPGLWVIQIHRAWRTYTDHPQKPANSQGVCLFTLSYWMDLNGTAPDGRGVPAVNTTVSDVNLC